MLRIFSLIFVVLFACGCAVSGIDSPKSVKLKDFEPLIKEAISQKPLNIEKLGIEDYSGKDSAEFYTMPQVKILELLKAYQKEHFRFNATLEKLAKDKSQKDFVKYYKKAQRNILADMLFEYYGIKADVDKRISYDEFVNFADSFFAEQGQFIADFGEYFFIALDEMDNESVCKDASCEHGTEMFNLVEIIASLKEQNKLTDRLQSIFHYGHKGFNDYVRNNFANKGLNLWNDRLNIKNLLTTKLSKEQLFDFLGAFNLDDAPTNLEKFMDYWTSIYLGRLYMAKYGMEIALDNKNAESIIESNPEMCLFDIYLDKNATKICENLSLLQRMVEKFMEKITEPNGKFLTFFDDKMCVIVDFGVLDSGKYIDSDISKKPKIITNPNNTSIACNVLKEALRDFQAR